MSRNIEIESILDAWWESEHCLPGEREKSENKLNALLDGIVAKGQNQCTREDVLDFLWPQYKEHRAAKKRAEILGVAQSVLKRS